MNKKMVDMEIIAILDCTGQEGFEADPENEPIADCMLQLKKGQILIDVDYMMSDEFYPQMNRRLVSQELKPMLLNKIVRVEIKCAAKEKTGQIRERKKKVDNTGKYHPYIEGEVIETYQIKYSSRKGKSKDGEEGYYLTDDKGPYGTTTEFITKDGISEGLLDSRIVEKMIVDCGIPITVHNDKNYKTGDWVFVECKWLQAINHGIVK